MENIILLGDRVLVKPDEVSSKIESTIDLHKTDATKSKEKPQTGYVLSIGDDCKLVKVGDRVFFNNYAGLEFDIPAKVKILGIQKDKLLIMSEREVMAVIERENDIATV